MLELTYSQKHSPALLDKTLVENSEIQETMNKVQKRCGQDDLRHLEDQRYENLFLQIGNYCISVR